MLGRVANWPQEDREELAQLAVEIAARRHGVFHAKPEGLKAIDGSLTDVARGNITSDADAEAVLAQYRRS